MKISKTNKLIDIKIENLLGGELFGLLNSIFSGEGIIFEKHRKYFFGDNIKHIDWKIYSRINELYVKEFEEERNLKIHFFINLSETIYQLPRKLNLLKEIFYLLSLSSIYKNANNLISININGKIFDYSRNIETPLKVLDYIDNLLKKQKKGKIPTLYNLNDLLKKQFNFENNLIIILTDEYIIEDENILSNLASKNKLIYINIFDKFELYLDEITGKELDFKLDNEILSAYLSGIEKTNKLRYSNLVFNELSLTEKYLESMGIFYILTHTGIDYYKILYNKFLEIKGIKGY